MVWGERVRCHFSVLACVCVIVVCVCVCVCVIVASLSIPACVCLSLYRPCMCTVRRRERSHTGWCCLQDTLGSAGHRMQGGCRAVRCLSWAGFTTRAVTCLLDCPGSSQGPAHSRGLPEGHTGLPCTRRQARSWCQLSGTQNVCLLPPLRHRAQRAP